MIHDDKNLPQNYLVKVSRYDSRKIIECKDEQSFILAINTELENPALVKIITSQI